MTCRLAIAMLVGCGLVGAGFAEAQTTVKARVDSAYMLIGDPNRLVVTVEGASEVRGIGWQVFDTMEAVVVTSDPARQTTPTGEDFVYPFSVYDSVGLLFPPVPVYLPGETLYTNSTSLVVDFAPVDSTLNPYRPLRTESANLSDYLPWIIGAIVLLLCLAGAFYFFYFAREEERADLPPPPPPDPPHVIALRELKVLGAGTGLDDKDFYSRLDHILRQYLEGRYDIPALERTSGEVTELLREESLRSTDELADLLSQVDLVKFAKAELPAERRATAAERVRAFVEATKRRAVIVEADAENDAA